MFPAVKQFYPSQGLYHSHVQRFFNQRTSEGGECKMPSGSLGGLYPSQVEWAQEICKLPEKSTKLSSPGKGRVGLSV